MAQVDEPLTITPWVEEDGRPTPYFYQLMLGLWRKTGSSDTLLSATLEETQDIVGAMTTSNTETGIDVTYQDADGTIDYEVNGVLDDLNTIGVATADGEFIVATGAGVFAYESGATARTSMGVAIGTDTQAWDAQLDDIAALAVTNSNFIVGDGSNWVAESSTTARASLGLIIGTDVQAEDPVLTDIAALSAVADNEVIVGTGAGTYAHESGATLRTSLGVDAAGTDNSTDVTLAGTPNYLTLSGQAITLTKLDISDDTNATGGTGIDISGNDFTLDLNELTTETTIASGDFIAMVDITDSGSGKITFANLESTLNHDSLTGFVANEHIDHSSVSISAGTGLTGGGDITATRTLSVDLVLEDLDTLGVAAADGEFIVATGSGVFAYETGATARASLGLIIGTDVQAEDAVLTDIAALSAVADNEFIVGTGAGTYAHESGTTVRTSIGLGTGDSPTFSGLTLTGDVTVYDDQNNADTKIEIGTSATEQLLIQVLNGAANKTAESILFKSSTASGTADHGKYTFQVDDTTIIEFLDAGIDITGTIVVSGTVDGRDLQTDGTKLDGIESNATADQSTEEIQDIAGPLVASGGTKTGITVTYQDSTDDMDFVVDVTASSTTTFTNKTFDANATGNALSNVDVADLADGVDGELITWSSLAAPETVAVGTSGHILTSNGVGNAPTFQANAGGGANDTLSNLGTVACNTSLISDTDSTDDLGNAVTPKRWANVFTDSIGDTGQTLNIAGTHTATAQPAFLAYNSANDDNVTGQTGVATVDFDTEVFDQGGDFATDVFTAPIAGRYLLSTSVSYSGITSAADDVRLLLITSNRNYRDNMVNTNDLPSVITSSISVVADMDAADTASVTLRVRGESSDVVDITGEANAFTFFSGCLLV